MSNCPTNYIQYNGQVLDPRFANASYGLFYAPASLGGSEGIQSPQLDQTGTSSSWFNGDLNDYASSNLSINSTYCTPSYVGSTIVDCSQTQGLPPSGWVWVSTIPVPGLLSYPADGSPAVYIGQLVLANLELNLSTGVIDPLKIKLNQGEYVSFKGHLTQPVTPGTTLTFNLPIESQIIYWDYNNPVYINNVTTDVVKQPIWGYQIKIGNSLSQVITANPVLGLNGEYTTSVYSSGPNAITIPITIGDSEQSTDIFEVRVVSLINSIDPTTNQGYSNYRYEGIVRTLGGLSDGVTVTGCIPSTPPPPPPPPPGGGETSTTTTTCSPVVFNLNDGKKFEIPSCDNDLELSMWLYFGQPSTECYDPTNPILGKITTTDPLVDQYLVQTQGFNSSGSFDNWVQLKATLPTSGLTFNFGINLELSGGLDCCCTYDIFVDDIKIGCSKQESAILVNDIQCPGFVIDKVIDNKKSWVYNPGVPSVGISEYDRIEREDGSFGTLNGEGTINRTFAPSLDADIPWRYTNYFDQSSVREKHSNLVLNTKELDLTFDMCADCLKYSAITYTTEFTECHIGQYVDIPLTAYTSNGVFVYMSFLLKYTNSSYYNPFYNGLLPANSHTNTGLTFNDFVTFTINSVNNYTTTIPGSPYTAYTTSFNSGQNAIVRIKSLSTGCTESGFLTLKTEFCPNPVFDPENPTLCENTISFGFLGNFTGGTTTITSGITTGITYTYASLYELENYKKQFQSFWVPFMEQFIPATTIWVAGERWCNEPCPIINPCDYDFELVDAELSFEAVPEGFYPTTCTCPQGYVPGGTGPYVGADPGKCINLNDINDVIPCGSTPTTVPTPQTSTTDLGGQTTGQNTDPNQDPNYTLVQNYGQTKETPNV